ncbi:hypothetical protein HAX54_002529 [Datura stramonium]|uniref:Disease resistance R13L4/SHOC-2-like LRR domain-containing protein n=1 Tax=Datura stramonium TaxID=4076 RepID=A0ABS8T4S8_DATST|nr:hypothetical protein [Datura stramonium]
MAAELLLPRAMRMKLHDVRAMVPTMERLARDMVEKCRGLPLAVVVLSGLLSHKRGIEEWQKVKAHIWRHMKDDSIEISYILSLSYNDLSIVLKQCFLYFAIFPEDHVSDAEHLMWLWMAEGIHDLLRDLAEQKASELNFFDIYDPKGNSISSLCLRHGIHDQAERYLSLDLSNLKLRSVIFLDRKCKIDLIKFSNMFQHIYVLHLETRSGTILPDAIGSLYHLKLLSLRGIRHLPSSIGNLKNLQTLRVFDSDHLLRLPPETANLINLRHLVAFYSNPLQVSKLTNLQVLKYAHCDQWKNVDPINLVNLQELVMHDINQSYSLNKISSLKNLSILKLSCDDNESFPDYEYLSSCQKLYKLWLRGTIEKLPLPSQFPNSITMIALRNSFLTEDPMPILGMLPNLRNLDLVAAYEGTEITCGDNSFCQLEFLRLYHLEDLERWHLVSSAMPLIKGFGISYCPKLKEIPKRMKDVAIPERLLETYFG